MKDSPDDFDEVLYCMMVAAVGVFATLVMLFTR